MSRICRPVGITVGVGPLHTKLASLAAQCFTAHTGLPVSVLGCDEFVESGLSHPAAMRLRLFDYTEADVAVYFDADWFCLNPWNPSLYAADGAFIACPDFVLESEWPGQTYDYGSSAFVADGVHETLPVNGPFREDYITQVREFAKLEARPYHWINSGLFIAHRREHETLLARALNLYEKTVGHHSAYYEQPALNKALETTKTRVRFLSRKHNVLAAYERIWNKSVVGLHIKVKRHHAFIGKIDSGAIADSTAVRSHFLNEQ